MRATLTGDTPWREKEPLPADYPVVYISRNLWEAADRAGYDMRFYKIVEPIPGAAVIGSVLKNVNHVLPPHAHVHTPSKHRRGKRMH